MKIPYFRLAHYFKVTINFTKRNFQLAFFGIFVLLKNKKTILKENTEI